LLKDGTGSVAARSETNADNASRRFTGGYSCVVGGEDTTAAAGNNAASLGDDSGISVVAVGACVVPLPWLNTGVLTTAGGVNGSENDVSSCANPGGGASAAGEGRVAF